ncbi:MAG: tetratricopeptide repeat protein, partial [Halobaculum sp.]
MFRVQGKPLQEQSELETARETAERVGVDSASFEPIYHTRRGHFAWGQGAFDEAREAYERVQEIADQEDDESMKATVLGNLGLVARNQGEY